MPTKKKRQSQHDPSKSEQRNARKARFVKIGCVAFRTILIGIQGDTLKFHQAG